MNADPGRRRYMSVVEKAAKTIHKMVLEQGWKVNGLRVTDSIYACDTGCEYWRLYVLTADGKEEVCGDFGTLREYGGSKSDDLLECEGLAAALGVPLIVEFLWS
jgi:hypothetical protein